MFIQTLWQICDKKKLKNQLAVHEWYICLKISTSNRGEDTAIEETKVVNCGRYKELWKSFLKTLICCIWLFISSCLTDCADWARCWCWFHVRGVRVSVFCAATGHRDGKGSPNCCWEFPSMMGVNPHLLAQYLGQPPILTNESGTYQPAPSIAIPLHSL